MGRAGREEIRRKEKEDKLRKGPYAKIGCYRERSGLRAYLFFNKKAEEAYGLRRHKRWRLRLEGDILYLSPSNNPASFALQEKLKGHGSWIHCKSFFDYHGIDYRKPKVCPILPLEDGSLKIILPTEFDT